MARTQVGRKCLRLNFPTARSSISGSLIYEIGARAALDLLNCLAK
jgi:hypothetical protein